MPNKRLLPQILLIENNMPTIALYQRELANSYNVFPCHDEESILNHLQADEIALIIFEPAFLGIDGWNLLTKIKDATPFTYIPIIVCTTQDACLLAMELGADRCLVKPVLPITLHHLLDELV